LYKIDELPNEIIRLQTQLSKAFNHTKATHIIKEGKLFSYGRGKNGFDFYESTQEYKILN